MKYTKRITRSGDNDDIEIHLVQGEGDDGAPFYAYLAIYASMVREMELSLLTKHTNLEDYGVILAQGEGEPDEETRQYIKEHFLKES